MDDSYPEKTRAALDHVRFYCRACRHRFSRSPETVEDDPEREYHPYRYSATCPACGETAGQAPWEIALMASYGKHTGPKTPEGRARSSRNLDGHPTPEESLRTRFNAMKHGLSARVATYFPARPGKYPHCTDCEYLNAGCGDMPACLKRTELFMRHQIAFETGDPGLLADLRADTQAAIQAIINDIILAVVSEGVQIKTPEWAIDKDGRIRIAQYTDEEGNDRVIHKLYAHPLLKTLTDFLAKNNLSLADLNMTPKGQGEQEILRGYLDDEGQTRQGLLEHAEKQSALLESLSAQIERSRERTKRDPVLIEYSETADG